MQIGNAAIDVESDNLGMYQYFGNHALISPKTTRQIEKQCFFSPEVINQKCFEAITEANINIGNLDIYDIYAPIYLDGNLTAKPKKVTVSSFMIRI